MMLIVKLILLLSVFVTITFCECTESDVEVLDICYNEFFESFNFTFINPDDYSRRMLILLKSMEGVDEICDNYNTLKNCLGNDVIENCTNTDAFAKTNFSMGNPEGMISNYFVFQFQCGRGYDILKTEFECLSCFPNKCFYDLDTCNQWYDMIHCISKSAQKECSDDAGYYMFEILNIEECYMRPDCKVCPADGALKSNISLVLFFTIIISYLIQFYV